MDTATSPAQTVIDKFGGHEALAKALNRHPITIRRWTYSTENGGTGGLIPTRMQARILEEAKKLGLDLSPADLVSQQERAA